MRRARLVAVAAPPAVFTSVHAATLLLGGALVTLAVAAAGLVAILAGPTGFAGLALERERQETLAFFAVLRACCADYAGLTCRRAWHAPTIDDEGLGVKERDLEAAGSSDA